MSAMDRMLTCSFGVSNAGRPRLGLSMAFAAVSKLLGRIALTTA